MHLLKVKNGHTFPYSLPELKAEYPNVSFPPTLAGVDLDKYGCVFSDAPVERVESPSSNVYRVTMPQFLWALRQANMREQFEWYTLSIEGHARDYWHTAAYVNKGHNCVKHFAEFFSLSKCAVDALFATAGSIEE